jgi:hypothetical protein
MADYSKRTRRFHSAKMVRVRGCSKHWNNCVEIIYETDGIMEYEGQKVQPCISLYKHLFSMPNIFCSSDVFMGFIELLSPSQLF